MLNNTARMPRSTTWRARRPSGVEPGRLPMVRPRRADSRTAYSAIRRSGAGKLADPFRRGGVYAELFSLQAAGYT
jgi:hypothetical protein